MYKNILYNRFKGLKSPIQKNNDKNKLQNQ